MLIKNYEAKISGKRVLGRCVFVSYLVKIMWFHGLFMFVVLLAF